MHVEVKPFHIVGCSLPPLVVHMLLLIWLSLVFLSCHIKTCIFMYIILSFMKLFYISVYELVFVGGEIAATVFAK